MNEIRYTVEAGSFPLLTEMLVIPLAAAVICLCVSAKSARWVALLATLANLALGIFLWSQYQLAGEQWQFQELPADFSAVSPGRSGSTGSRSC
jgi:NADH-quinone oxidoreductase subunit M